IVPMKDARHAVTLRASGVDILMHVGIDTVALGGRGFELLVAAGQKVRERDPLLRFDLDFVARHARSCVSPIVLASGGSVLRKVAHRHVEAGEFLMEVGSGDADAAAQESAA